MFPITFRKWCRSHIFVSIFQSNASSSSLDSSRYIFTVGWTAMGILEVDVPSESRTATFGEVEYSASLTETTHNNYLKHLYKTEARPGVWCCGPQHSEFESHQNTIMAQVTSVRILKCESWRLPLALPVRFNIVNIFHTDVGTWCSINIEYTPKQIIANHITS